MANRTFRQFFNTLHKYPVLIDCNFIVDSTNGNGLGIRSLKPSGAASGVANVYMHTSATAAAGNPNPAAGFIVVQLTDSYYKYLGGFSGQVAVLGASGTSTTAHTPAVITVLGTATLAQWQTAGLPVGMVPAVGLAFVPTASGVIGGSAQVAPIATTGSGIDHIEVLGDANLSIDPNGPSSNGRGQIVLACFSGGAVTAPADGAAIGLAFYLSNSGSSSAE